MARQRFPERPLCAVWQALADAGMPPLDGCTRWADALHEPLTRARGGSIVDEANTVPVCNPCNSWLSARPESELGWAYDAGLLIHSWAAA